MSHCINIPGWTDFFGQECEFYSNNTIAYCTEDYAKSRTNGGYSALTACCDCKSLVPLAFEGQLQVTGGFSTLPADNLETASQDDLDCIDLPGWSSPHLTSKKQFTCADFVGDPSMCLLYGHRSSNFHKIPANKACCACNGGYNGTLIGRSLRVGLVEDEGTFKENARRVMEFLAKSSGFGMNIAANFTLFRSCLEALSYEYVDLCLVSGYNIPTGAWNYSKPLGEDKFYVGVPLKQPPEKDTYLAMIQPFQYQLWICLFLFLFITSLFINIIQKGGCWVERLSWRNRFASSIYHTLRSCATGDLSNSSDYPRKSEKILTLSFVLFALIIVTAYTANLAAILSESRTATPAFENFDDIKSQLRNHNSKSLCFSEVFSDIVLDHVSPQDLEIIEFVPQWPVDILNGIISPEGLFVTSDKIDSSSTSGDETKKCVGSFFSRKVYNLVKYDTSYDLCRKLTLLPKDYWIYEHSIPLSQRVVLEPWGMDLLERLNYFIDHKFTSTTYDDIDEIINEEIMVSKQRKGVPSRVRNNEEQDLSNSNECGVESSSSQLSLETMQGPFLVFGIISMCGIVAFMSKRTNQLLARRFIYSRCPICRWEWLALSDGDNIYLRRKELKTMPPSDILDQLAKKHVSQRLIDREISKLPDKKGLEDLMFSVEYQDFVANITLLSNLTISALFKIVKDCELGKRKNQSEVLDYTATPKVDLIRLIIDDPIALSVGKKEAIKLIGYDELGHSDTSCKRGEYLNPIGEFAEITGDSVKIRRFSTNRKSIISTSSNDYNDSGVIDAVLSKC